MDVYVHMCACVESCAKDREIEYNREDDMKEGRWGGKGLVMTADSPLFVHSFGRQWRGFSWFCPKAVLCIGC